MRLVFTSNVGLFSLVGVLGGLLDVSGFVTYAYCVGFGAYCWLLPVFVGFGCWFVILLVCFVNCGFVFLLTVCCVFVSLVFGLFGFAVYVFVLFLSGLIVGLGFN